MVLNELHLKTANTLVRRWIVNGRRPKVPITSVVASPVLANLTDKTMACHRNRKIAKKKRASQT